ncbi:hypothetical protein DOM22_13290 [Bdellovibrio sp. ZAP7]|uniref:hypothetical protein n=1 Tax=Bdellovibrio sp. ZAP7 TaxID=2231053 RepID=UPI00115A7410|nr:hypothetical protein [Bdellovibrio sp. ZAP7]QDK46061.1 hypothetical protein DOM22_13290 [Bdellovibrio sp. ZAP7]
MRNLRGNLAKLFILIGSAVTIVSFQNCSKAAFNIDAKAKQSALDNGTVFGATDSAEYPDEGTNTPDSSEDDGTNVPDDSAYSKISVTPNPVCGPKVGDTSKLSILSTTSKIVGVLYKSTMGSIAAGATVVQVYDSEAYSKSFKDQLTTSKNIELPISAPLTEGVYSVVFYDGAKASSPYKYSMDGGAKAVAPILDSVAAMLDVNSAFRIGKDGKLQGKVQIANVLVGFEGDAACANADKIDPLLLQLNTKSPKPISLTSPENGVMFDLLGALNNHKPVKSAWFASADTEDYFLVLPNGQGKVLGINELFGDATLGPDKKFAKQGFAALAKYDDDKDKIITGADSVFSSLKLWKDDNLDGIAQASELHSLDEKGVIAIDLRYDRRYKEVDQHGNMVRYKSVVVMKDNSYGLVYDLYLRFIK